MDDEPQPLRRRNICRAGDGGFVVVWRILETFPGHHEVEFMREDGSLESCPVLGWAWSGDFDRELEPLVEDEDGRLVSALDLAAGGDPGDY